MAGAIGLDRDEAERVRLREQRRRARMNSMDTALVELLARRAGLDKALAEFPDDVAAAARQAGEAAARINAPADPRAEPWPPMRAGAGL